MGIFDRFKRNRPDDKKTPQSDRSHELRSQNDPISAEQVVGELERLGYFTYADPTHLQQLKAELGKGLSEDHYFPLLDSGSPKYEFLDPRHYNLDNEDLFEQGGVLNALKEMAPLFAKMNIKMKVSNHVEEYDQVGLNHRITINGKPYVIFHQWEGYGWGESAQRFADIVNDQLAIQNSNERLYLIQGANDGRAVFLTADQHALVRALIPDLNECPLPTQEWCQIMGVTWQNVT